MDDPTSSGPAGPAPRARRPLLVGGAVALAAGLALAWSLTSRHQDEPTVAPPASHAGLVIDSTGKDDGRLDPARPLRCFVAGQLVGELTLAECARRNGVATGALGVGLDETGALAAGGGTGALVTPLPPAPVQVLTPPAQAAAATPAAAALGPCWRYADAQWRKLPDMALNACVQTLFAGHCEKPGGATYGRWSQQTLRLVPGKVETSSDNRSFHSLTDQSAACVIAPFS